jgi:hypothetical protein
MSESNEEKGMGTAKARKARPATRKRKSADVAPSPADETAMDGQPVGSIPTVEDAALDTSSTNEESTRDVTEDEIRRRAYELYVSRGAADGNDLSDWLEAERLVRSSRRPQSDAARDEGSEASTA